MGVGMRKWEEVPLPKSPTSTEDSLELGSTSSPFGVKGEDL